MSRLAYLVHFLNLYLTNIGVPRKLKYLVYRNVLKNQQERVYRHSKDIEKYLKYLKNIMARIFQTYNVIGAHFASLA